MAIVEMPKFWAWRCLKNRQISSANLLADRGQKKGSSARGCEVADELADGGGCHPQKGVKDE